MKGLLSKVCLGGSGALSLSSRYVGALLGGGLPARRFVTLHLFGDSHVRQGGCASLGPDWIAVGMVAVVMSIEDVLDGFGRDAVGGFQGESRAAGEIGVDDDQVILHLDDDVVGVAEVREVAFTEPDAGNDQFDLARLRLGTGREKRHGGKDCKAG